MVSLGSECSFNFLIFKNFLRHRLRRTLDSTICDKSVFLYVRNFSNSVYGFRTVILYSYKIAKYTITGMILQT